MKVSRIEIKKFRSIKEASFHLGKVTAIVGENNAGKTAVLRALNAVMNFEEEKENFLLKRHQYASRNNTYITVVFEDIPDRERYAEFVLNGEMTVKFSFSYSARKEKYELLSKDGFSNAPEGFIRDISEDLIYAYIPAERSGDDLSCDESALFGELVSKYFAQHVKYRDTVSSQVKSASKRMHDNVLVKLEKELSRLYMQNKAAGFQIDFPESIDYHIFLSSIQITFNEKQTSHLVQEWGSGTRSLAIIAMHRANALLRGASVVLGIEEPETNLHPQAQRRFLRSLEDELADQETQALFTTHSPVLIDALGHEDILLVRRQPDERRGFHSKLSQLPKDFWEKNKLDDFKHYQFFRYRNSDFFFSKYVIVCESKNDCQVIEHLVKDELNELIDDVSFLEAGGVGNLKYPYFLFKELEMPCTFVVDRDFFFPYANDNRLDDSRDQSSGLPKYSVQLKSNTVLKDLLNSEVLRREVLDAHSCGYRRLFSTLSLKGFLVMNYCLEMDLTCSSAARERYYEELRIPDKDRSQKTLLIEKASSVKEAETILKVMEALKPISYPESYKKIRNALISSIRTTIE